jgi:predicted HicB family RNase H-like nuclease
MEKNLEYYLNLDYRVVIEKIKEEDGGGYMAYIDELGKWTCNACGETPEEAYNNLIEYKEDLIKRWFSENKKITEPEKEDILPSGKFTLRVPAELHAKLIKAAKKNNISFNQYCIYLLSSNITSEQIIYEIKQLNKKIPNNFYQKELDNDSQILSLDNFINEAA